MKNGYFLSIDLGSSMCKAILYNLSFRKVISSHKEVITNHPNPTWSEQDPNEWWRLLIHTTREVISKINPEYILGIGVCGQSHGPVLVDERGKVLFPCIVWSDLRAIKHAEIIKQATGKIIHAYYTAPKLLWIKDKYPEIFNKMYKFLLPKDFLRMKLTGAMVTDITDATWTMMYDVKNQCWDNVLQSFIGISDDKFPKVYPSEMVVGKVNAKAAKKTGLKEGTPVIAGAADAHCMIIGLRNFFEPGKAVIYLGTAPGIFVCTKEYQKDWRIKPIRWALSGNEKTLLFGNFISVGGASLKWFIDQFGDKEIRVAKKSKVSPYKVLDDEANKVEPGSDGLLFLPHLIGERSPYNPYSKGVMFGLSLGHRREHIVRSLMEGVAYQLKMIVDEIESEINEIIVVGGGAKSRVWRQIIADMFERPVVLLEDEEISSLGLAFLTSIGLGIHKNIFEASEQLHLKLNDKIEPRRKFHERYKKMYEIYKDLEEVLSDLFKLQYEID